MTLSRTNITNVVSRLQLATSVGSCSWKVIIKELDPISTITMSTIQTVIRFSITLFDNGIYIGLSEASFHSTFYTILKTHNVINYSAIVEQLFLGASHFIHRMQ